MRGATVSRHSTPAILIHRASGLPRDQDGVE
jgi:hypothetical protein